MYELIYSESALKQLQKLERNIQKRILIVLERLRITPELCDIRKLIETKGYRLRIGDYRVIFDIEKDKLLILKIGHRKNVYRM